MKTRLALRSAAAALALCAVSLILWAPQLAYAAGPWYVAPGGNDLSDCLSPATPCGTINGAIGKASADDTIFVATGTYTGTGDNVVSIDRDITLSGGWDSAFAQQTGLSTIDGQGTRRGIFNTAVATIDRFLIQNGLATLSAGLIDGGGVFNFSGALTLDHCVVMANVVSGAGHGGGIFNYGLLTLHDTTVTSNTAAYGGGIFNAYVGTISLDNSVIDNNTAPGDGGGLLQVGTLTMTNSTITGNRTGDSGGGIWINGSSGATAIANSTINSNSAASGGGIYVQGYYTVTVRSSTISGNGASVGGGLLNYHNQALTLQNTILAKNESATGPDCNGALGSLGYNLVGDPSTCTGAASTDLVNVDPLLGPLTGSPGYYPLLYGSPAVNAGNPAGCTDNLGNPLPTDQRGMPRVGRCDIGAFEMQAIESSKKTVSASAAAVGTPLSYTITFSNIGTVDLANVVVTDTLPAALTFQGGSLAASSGSYGYANGAINWSGIVAAGQGVSITYGAAVTLTARGQIANSAVISDGGETITRSATTNVAFWQYLPLVLNKPGISGQVKRYGTPLAGVVLLLRFYDGSAWYTAAATVPDAKGNYVFQGVPSLRSGQKYYVLFDNSAGTVPGCLWAWGTKALTAYTAGTTVDIGHFDIGEISLLAPGDGAFVAMPSTFRWAPRAAAPTDSYVLEMYDPHNPNTYASTPELGYVGTVTVTGLPSSFVAGHEYYWDMVAFSPDGGNGVSYASWMMMLLNTGHTSATALGSIAPERGPLFDDLLAQHPRRVP